MNPISTALAVTTLAVGICTAAQASTQVIDFDDIPTSATSGSVSHVSSDYRGYQWDGALGANSWNITHVGAEWFPGPQSHSGNNFAWAGTGASLGIVATAGVFDLTSLWARVATFDGMFTARGYLSGIETFNSSFAVTSTYAVVILNFIGIDRFVIEPHGTVPMIDDITITAVPEPAVEALFAVGLGFVRFVALRRLSNSRVFQRTRQRSMAC